MPDQAPHAICTIDDCDVKILPNTLYCPVHRALRQYEDQAPQTLDEITDKLINDVVGYTERMHSVWSPVLFLGEYKDEAEAALTTLIERVIGEKFVKHTQKGYEEFTHRRKRSDGDYEYVSHETAFIVNREIDEQRKRLANLTKNGESDDPAH